MREPRPRRGGRGEGAPRQAAETGSPEAEGARVDGAHHGELDRPRAIWRWSAKVVAVIAATVSIDAEVGWP
jgi:hypothetical protein